VFDGTTGYNTPSTAQNYSFGETAVFGPDGGERCESRLLQRPERLVYSSFNQNWGQQLGFRTSAPALMPAFSANGSGAAPNTVAPDYGQLYGLTVNGPSRSIRQNLSFRDDFSKNVGTHAFKVGYEILNAQANYYQLGQPSGVFQFDNITAGLQPNGQPVPNTGNTFAGFELGAVRQANFSTYTTTWLRVTGSESVRAGRLEVFKQGDVQSGAALVDESPFRRRTDWRASSALRPWTR